MMFPSFSKASKSWDQLDNIIKFLRANRILQGVEKQLSLTAAEPVSISHQLNRKAKWIIVDINSPARVYSTSNEVNNLTIVSDIDTTLTLWVY